MCSDDDDLDDLRFEMQRKRRGLGQFLAHPDPRDPDHPDLEDDDGNDD